METSAEDDEKRMWAVPVIGRGVGGAIPGRDPAGGSGSECQQSELEPVSASSLFANTLIHHPCITATAFGALLALVKCAVCRESA